MIYLEHLRTGFEGRIVSRDISLTLERGQLLTLIGPNGCGKTTLLRTLARSLPPLGGTYLLKDRPIGIYKRKGLARTVAYLPQSRETPDISAESLIAHGRFPHLSFSRKLTKVDLDAIEEAIELTDVGHLRHKSLKALSGGERQRVYLAMVIAQQTELVLLDEPATYLDIGSRFAVLEIAKQLCSRGAAVVMTMHDLSDAMTFSDRICLMDKGGDLRHDGDPESLYRSGLLEEVFGVTVEKAALSGGQCCYCFLPKQV